MYFPKKLEIRNDRLVVNDSLSWPHLSGARGARMFRVPLEIKASHLHVDALASYVCVRGTLFFVVEMCTVPMTQ